MAVCPKCEQSYPKVGIPCSNSICVPDKLHAVYDKAARLAERDTRIGKITADKFVITGRISKGGMGAVYTAMQMPVEREVALKVLRTEMEDSDQGRDRFIQEAKAISRLTHPNIITLFDFGFEESGHPYMVMEYAPGMHLGQWAKKEDLTIERISMVIQQLLSALDEAHDQGIVHRDLKPENMIVIQKGSQQDYVKLLDFGIARVVTESSTRGLTREGEVFGTPHFMAPEQAQGAKDLGPAADIYAVGIIMHYLICGKEPFDADSAVAILLKHISEPLPALTPRPGILLNPQIEAIVARACAKDPTERFQSAKEMIGALIDATVSPDNSGVITGAYIGVNHQPSNTQEFAEAPTLDPVQAPAAFVPAAQQDFFVPPVDQQDLTPPPQSSKKWMAPALLALLLLAGGVGIAVFLSMDPEGPTTGPDTEVVATTPAETKEPAQTPEPASEPPPQAQEDPPPTQEPAAEVVVAKDEPVAEPSVEPTPEPDVEVKPAPAVDKTPRRVTTKRTKRPPRTSTKQAAASKPSGPSKFTFKPTAESTRKTTKPRKFAAPKPKPKKFSISQ